MPTRVPYAYLRPESSALPPQTAQAACLGSGHMSQVIGPS